MQGWDDPEWREPQWTKPDTYSYTDGFTDSQWAWEFLRRDPKYRKAWKGWFDAGKPVTKAELKDAKELSPFPGSVTDDAARMVRATAEAKNWHLLFPADPHFPTPDRAVFWRRDTRPWEPVMLHKDSSLAGFKEFLRYGQHVQAFALALDRPIDAQIKLLRHKAMKYREAHGLDPKASAGAHRKNWPRYLRALDAKSADVNYGEIAHVLHGDSALNSDAKDTCKQAARVRDGGYVKFALRLPKNLYQYDYDEALEAWERQIEALEAWNLEAEDDVVREEYRSGSKTGRETFTDKVQRLKTADKK